MQQKNLVVKEGNDSHCSHFELIEDMIGTCKWCGRVKNYNRVLRKESAADILNPQGKKRKGRG